MNLSALLNLLRGALVGIAEVIPGVSGGTIALIVGVYERVIDSAAAASKAILAGLRVRFQDARQHISQIDFRLLIPLLVGMFTAIFLAAAAIEPLLQAEPEAMRGLFFGMIAVSLYVPYRLAASRWLPRDFVIAVLAAALSFALLSLPRGAESEPQLITVFVVAMIAVCALVLPGVSGSFLLLALGYYAPTIAAVNDRDLAYLGVFVLGAITGLALFSTLLSWLLDNRRRVTLVVMTGLMLGSLRALWPWQSDSGELSSPQGAVPMFFALLGAAIVAGIMLVERRVQNRQ